MAYTFKRLSDVGQLNKPTEQTHVLVEDNNEIKKILVDNLGGGTVKTVNGTEPDESGNIDIEIPSYTVNGVEPDENGNFEVSTGTVKTVNGVEPDEDGDIKITVTGGADWAQNDEEGSGYIKNRTHYESDELQEEIILPPLELNNLLHYYSTNYGGITDLELDSYTVIWNDVEYTCPVITIDNQKYLGNIKFLNPLYDDSGEPFLFIYDSIEFISSEKVVSQVGILEKDITFTVYYSSPQEALAQEIDLENITSCKVIWDEQEYDVFVSKDGSFVEFGDSTLKWVKEELDSYNYPFYYFSDGQSFVIHALDTQPHVMSIITREKLTKKIDLKFLPKGQGGIVTRTGELISNLELTNFVEDEPGSGVYGSMDPLGVILEENYPYTVIWDGTTYEFIAKTHPELDDIIYLGNPNHIFVDQSGDYSFGIFTFNNNQTMVTATTNTNHFITISGTSKEIQKISKKILPNGLVFVNENNESIGSNSLAEGYFTIAYGNNSHAEGEGTEAHGENSHAEGEGIIAHGVDSHAEGQGTAFWHGNSPSINIQSNSNIIESSYYADRLNVGDVLRITDDNDEEIYAAVEQIQGDLVTLDKKIMAGSTGVSPSNIIGISYGDFSHSEGRETNAIGEGSHSEGDNTAAIGAYSHTEGQGTKATGDFSHVQGRYNIEDTEGRYVHIVGNGEDDENRSNAHTLDWYGNAWYANSVAAKYFVLESPDGSLFKITVDNSGTLSAEAMPE